MQVYAVVDMPAGTEAVITDANGPWYMTTEERRKDLMVLYFYLFARVPIRLGYLCACLSAIRDQLRQLA